MFYSTFYIPLALIRLSLTFYQGIKDMDYIIKEKTFLENLLNCEFDNNLTDSKFVRVNNMRKSCYINVHNDLLYFFPSLLDKGTFYIDKSLSFSQMFLYGNEMECFVLQFLLFLAVYLMFHSLLGAAVAVCLFNKVCNSSKEWSETEILFRTF